MPQPQCHGIHTLLLLLQHRPSSRTPLCLLLSARLGGVWPQLHGYEREGWWKQILAGIQQAGGQHVWGTNQGTASHSHPPPAGPRAPGFAVFKQTLEMGHGGKEPLPGDFSFRAWMCLTFSKTPGSEIFPGKAQMLCSEGSRMVTEQHISINFLGN